MPTPSLLRSAGLLLCAILLASPALADTHVDLLRATSATASGSASFSVTLLEPIEAEYQWFKDDMPIPNAQAPTLLLPVVQVADAGAYHVRVANVAGAAISRPASLSVILQPDLVSQLPTDQTVAPGAKLVLRAAATGKNLSYQWYFKGAVLRGKNSATLSLTGVDASDAGAYSVKISNKSGPVAVGVAIVNVAPGAGQ